MTTDLKALWQEAFGDSKETVDAFFATGFSQDRCHYIVENNVPVSALYWFNCELSGCKLAYIYAVATLKSHRGKGLARRLMEEAHQILKEQGYEVLGITLNMFKNNSDEEKNEDAKKIKKIALQKKCYLFGDPYEIRTRVTAVKGRCLRPLDQRAELVAVIGFEPMTLRV